MTLLGRLCCFLAIFGLLSQLAFAHLVCETSDSDHAETACETSGEKTADSDHCPMGPVGDCCSICVHLFDVATPASGLLPALALKPVSFFASDRGTLLEGFPSGLFIPPRVS